MNCRNHEEGDASDNIWERDMKFRVAQTKVPAVVKPQTHMTAATPSPTTFGELMHAVNIVPSQSQMMDVTSRLGSSQLRPGSVKPQAVNPLISLPPHMVPDSSQMDIAKLVQHIRFFASIERLE